MPIVVFLRPLGLRLVNTENELIPKRLLNKTPNELIANKPKITEGTPERTSNAILRVYLYFLLTLHVKTIAAFVPKTSATIKDINDLRIVIENGYQNANFDGTPSSARPIFIDT